MLSLSNSSSYSPPAGISSLSLSPYLISVCFYFGCLLTSLNITLIRGCSKSTISRWKLFRESMTVPMEFTAVRLMRPDSSGIMHYVIVLIPCSFVLVTERTVLTTATWTSLSCLFWSGSFDPGVSISVILPILTGFTAVVTAVLDYPLWNL